MKKLVMFAFLMLLLLGSAGCNSQPRQLSGTPRVLVVIRSYASDDMPFMTDNELVVMINLLQDAGLKVRIASQSTEAYKSKTNTITPDLAVDDVDVADFDAVVLPCLAAGMSPASPEIVELVANFYKKGKVIAAQYGARYTLNEAGIIDKEQLTSSTVLQKGSVITSGCCPYMARSGGCQDGTRELIEKLVTTVTG